MRPAERHAITILFFGAGIAAGLALAFVPPRLTLVNAALRITYPWTAVAGAVLATAASFGLAVLVARRAVRIAAVMLAASTALLGAARAAYAIEAGPDALSERGLVTRRALPWREVTRVDSDASAISMTGGGTRLTIHTARLRPEQRVALERTVARRIREGGR